MEAVAGGVQHDLADILAEHETDLILCTGLGQAGGAVALHQALDDCLLDDALAGRHAGQLAVQRGTSDRESRIGGQKLLPVDGVDSIEQLVEGGGRIGVEEQHDPLHRAEVEVGGGDHLRTAFEGQTTVADPDVLGTDAAQLKVARGFAPVKAGGDEFKFCRHSGFLSCRVQQLPHQKTGPPRWGQAQSFFVLCGRLSGCRGVPGEHSHRPGGCWSRGRGLPSSPRSGS